MYRYTKTVDSVFGECCLATQLRGYPLLFTSEQSAPENYNRCGNKLVRNHPFGFYYFSVLAGFSVRLVVDIYLPLGRYPPLATDIEVNSC